MLRSSFLYLGLAALLAGCATAGEGSGDDDDDNDVDSGIDLMPDAPPGSADAPPGTPDAPPGTPDAPLGPTPITITASTSPGITGGNSVACISEDGNMVQLGHTANHYFREFPLNQFGITSDFNVTEVEIGFESATAGAGGSQPATLKLHTGSIASRTEIASQALTVPDIESGTVLPFSITGTVPAGGTLIVELFTPDGTTDTNFIFIGTNQSGEQTTTYIMAPDCMINAPTDASTLAPNAMHWVMNVKGTHIP